MTATPLSAAEPTTEAGRRYLGPRTHVVMDSAWYNRRAAVVAIEADAERQARADERRRWAGVQSAAKEAALILEVGDQRALAADGPVGHFRDELSDPEWRRLYVALEKIRKVALLADDPEPGA